MQQTCDNPNADFDRLVNDYFSAWFRFHPETAVDCGQNQFAGNLRPFANSQMGALQTLHENLLKTLEEVDYKNLDADHQLDFDALIGQVYLERQDMLQCDWRFRDPQKYLPFNAIDQLLQRPVTGFARAISARLKSIPDYLWNAQELMRQKPDAIPFEWLQQTIQSAKSGDLFMRSLVQHPKVEDAISRGPSLAQEIDEATKAVNTFRRFLENDIDDNAQGDFACGEHRFNKLLQLNHGLDINHQQLYEFGLKLAEQTYSELKQTCQRLAGHENVAQLTEQLSADHPDGKSLISIYQKAIQSAKDFLVDKDLVTMPQTQRLEVIETPVFLRHQIPFAAYMPPMVGDPHQQGYYYVTPSDDEQALGEHNFLAINHTSVHEAYPGHHLQFVTANLNPLSRSWPRIINTSATFYEGWALYCEQLMHEQGYLDQPLNKFILLKDRLWRALRILIDVDLHVHNVPQEQAAQKLCDRLGFTKQQAMADTSWYSHAPTVPMGYALGWAMINALREHEQGKDSFILKPFHDKLLASGSISLAQVIRRQFGVNAYNQVMMKITC